MRGLTHRITSVAVSFGVAVGGLAPAAHAAEVGPFHDGVCTVAPTAAETAAVSQMYANANESRALHERAYVSGFDAVYPGTRRVVEAAWADPEVQVAYDAYLAALAGDTFEITETQSAENDKLIARYASRLNAEAGMPVPIAEEVAQFFAANRIDVLTDQLYASDLDAQDYAPDVANPVILSTPPDETVTSQNVKTDWDAELAHARKRLAALEASPTPKMTLAPRFLSEAQAATFNAAAAKAPGVGEFYADEHALQLADITLRIACLEGGASTVPLPTSYRFGAPEPLLAEQGHEVPEPAPASRKSQVAPPSPAVPSDTGQQGSSRPVLGIILGVLAVLAAGIGAVVYFAPELGIGLPA